MACCWGPMSAMACLGAQRTRPGTSVQPCCPMRLIASPKTWKSASGTFPHFRMWASSRSSMALSRLRRMAIRWWGRSMGSETTGSRAVSWRASARAAASDWRCRTGWSTAIRVSTSGRWMWRVMGIGRAAPTRVPRWSKTTGVGSGCVFQTRSCRPPGRCARFRCTTNGSRWAQ